MLSELLLPAAKKSAIPSIIRNKLYASLDRERFESRVVKEHRRRAVKGIGTSRDGKSQHPITRRVSDLLIDVRKKERLEENGKPGVKRKPRFFFQSPFYPFLSLFYFRLRSLRRKPATEQDINKR